jgi:hypothetical protein
MVSLEYTLVEQQSFVKRKKMSALIPGNKFSIAKERCSFILEFFWI